MILRVIVVVASVLASLFPKPSAGAAEAEMWLGEWLSINTPKVIQYLLSLKESDIGKKLEGVTLSDDSVILRGNVFRGVSKDIAEGVHIYVMEESGKAYAYIWIEKGAHEFLLPVCKNPDGEEDAHVISGDVWTWTYAKPGEDLVISSCPPKEWLK